MTGLQFTNSRILIFDPSREAGVDTQRTLISLGVKHVFMTDTTEQALKSVDEVVPDIILSELTPDGADGFELLHRVREMESPLRNVPFIILTREAKKDFVHQAIESGAKGYVLKPCDPLSLKKHCMRILNYEGVS